jgi:CheY-like chemotaxis protein
MRAAQLTSLCRLWRSSRQSAGPSSRAPVPPPAPVALTSAVPAPTDILTAPASGAPPPAPTDMPTGPASGAPAPARAQVLLVGDDRRFRAVASTLLSRRGHAVTVGDHDDDVVDLAVRARADVVVIDAGASLTTAARQAARLEALRPRVTIFTVGEEPGEGLAALPVLLKWSCFDEVLAAVDRCMPPLAIGAGDGLR